jgi:hypothetical protein
MTATATATALQQGEENEGLQLSARTSKREYQAGEDVDLSLVLANVANTDVRVWNTALLRLYQIEMTLPTEKQAPLTLYGERQASSQGSRGTRILKPGDSMTKSTTALNRLYDMTLPGEYIIVAKVCLFKRGSDKETFTLVSNKATVKIMDR